jgi:hypothetical protein
VGRAGPRACGPRRERPRQPHGPRLLGRRAARLPLDAADAAARALHRRRVGPGLALCLCARRMPPRDGARSRARHRTRRTSAHPRCQPYAVLATPPAARRLARRVWGLRVAGRAPHPLCHLVCYAAAPTIWTTASKRVEVRTEPRTVVDRVCEQPAQDAQRAARCVGPSRTHATSATARTLPAAG